MKLRQNIRRKFLRYSPNQNTANEKADVPEKKYIRRSLRNKPEQSTLNIAVEENIGQRLRRSTIIKTEISKESKLIKRKVRRSIKSIAANKTDKRDSELIEVKQSYNRVKRGRVDKKNETRSLKSESQVESKDPGIDVATIKIQSLPPTNETKTEVLEKSASKWQRTKNWLTTVNEHYSSKFPEKKLKSGVAKSDFPTKTDFDSNPLENVSNCVSPLPRFVRIIPKKNFIEIISKDRYIRRPSILEELSNRPRSPPPEKWKTDLLARAVMYEINSKLFPSNKIKTFYQLKSYKDDFRNCHEYYRSIEFCYKVLQIKNQVTNWMKQFDEPELFNESRIPHRIRLPSILQSSYNPYYLLIILRILFPSDEGFYIGSLTKCDNEICLGLHSLFSSVIRLLSAPASTFNDVIPMVKFYSVAIMVVVLINDFKKKELTTTKQNIFQPNSKYKNHQDVLEALVRDSLWIENHWVHGKRAETCRSLASSLFPDFLLSRQPDDCLSPLTHPLQLLSMQHVNEYLRIVSGKVGKLRSFNQSDTLLLMIAMLDNCHEVTAIGGKIRWFDMRPVEVEASALTVHWAVLSVFRQRPSLKSVVHIARLANTLKVNRLSTYADAANALLAIGNSLIPQNSVITETSLSLISQPELNLSANYTASTETSSNRDLLHQDTQIPSNLGQKGRDTNYPPPQYESLASSDNVKSALQKSQNISEEHHSIHFPTQDENCIIQNFGKPVSPLKETFPSTTEKHLNESEISDDPTTLPDSTSSMDVNESTLISDSYTNSFSQSAKNNYKCDGLNMDTEINKPTLPITESVHYSPYNAADFETWQSLQAKNNSNDVFDYWDEEDENRSFTEVTEVLSSDSEVGKEDVKMALKEHSYSQKEAPDTERNIEEVVFTENEHNKKDYLTQKKESVEERYRRIEEEMEALVGSNSNESRKPTLPNTEKYSFFIPSSQDTNTEYCSQTSEQDVLPSFFAVVSQADSLPVDGCTGDIDLISEMAFPNNPNHPGECSGKR